LAATVAFAVVGVPLAATVAFAARVGLAATVAVAAVGLGLAATAFVPVLPASAQPVAASHSDAVDNAFRQLYADTRKEFIDADAPLIVCLGGKLIFYRGGKRVAEHAIIPPTWQTLKVVDHVPLGIFVALVTHTGAALEPERVEQLSRFHAAIEDARKEIESAALGATSAARQKRILDESQAFLKSVLTAGAVSKRQLDEFAGRMGVPTLQNADDAEQLELGEVDNAVQAWRKELPPSDWARLRVVVCDGHMPRQQEREMQYFAALLGEKVEGNRLVFMENGTDEQKALELLATHQLDAQIGRAFFHDPWRMHRDLLSDGARHYLRQHPPHR
jgi:hypothetical protein